MHPYGRYFRSTPIRCKLPECPRRLKLSKKFLVVNSSSLMRQELPDAPTQKWQEEWMSFRTLVWFPMTYAIRWVVPDSFLRSSSALLCFLKGTEPQSRGMSKQLSLANRKKSSSSFKMHRKFSENKPADSSLARLFSAFERLITMVIYFSLCPNVLAFSEKCR